MKAFAHFKTRPRQARPESPPAPASAPTPVVEDGAPPRPSWNATLVGLIGLAFSWMLSGGDHSSTIAHCGAVGVGLSFGLILLIEARSGLKNLVRADLFAMASFYFLTLYEFLFSQPYFDARVPASGALRALHIVLVGFAGLFIGRHLWQPRTSPFAKILQREVATSKILQLYWLCLILGYVYMLMCSGWNPMTMLKAMAGVRFSQPWGRGRLGDWRVIFSELSLLIYVIPPIAGMMLARRERYTAFQILQVFAGLLLTLYYGFSSGTRHLFGTYLVTFLIAFAFALPARKRGQLVTVAGACGAAMLFATYFMLQFRNFGLKEWMTGNSHPRGELQAEYVFVDYNLQSIAEVSGFFPDVHPYLGFEIPYLAIIRPVPRFLWPGKPEGMSIRIEDIMGYTDQVTIAATFAGEAYISGGMLGVFLSGMVLAGIAGWWNSLASPKNSELGILVYASGFFAVVLTMRSLFEFTTAMIPTVACMAIAQLVLFGAQAGIRKLSRGPKRLTRPVRPAAPGQRPGVLQGKG